MLSAFTATPLIELKQRDKSKIESLLAYGDKVLVGLNSGNLRIYRVNNDSNKSTETNGESEGHSQQNFKGVDLLREVEKFSRRGIEQLAIIKEANLLISLSDGHISIHDAQSFVLQEQLTQTKGAITFAITTDVIKDKTSGVPSLVSKLAVSVKRKLLLWSWQDSELVSAAVEIVLSAPPRTLTWATATKIICGTNSGYALVDVESKDITDLFGPGSIGGAGSADAGRFSGAGTAGISYMGMSSWVPKGLATKLSDDELLLAKDINTAFIDISGKSLDKRQIPWSVAPDAVGFSYPFLLALQPSSKGALEVRNPDTLSLLQTIHLQAASILHVPQPNISLAHAGKGFLVASERCIWRMGALKYDSQIDELVEKRLFDESISLLNLLEDALLDNKEKRLRDIKILKAKYLFEKRRFRDALDLFTEASAPPELVIRLYPRFVSGFSETSSTKNVDFKANGSPDPNKARPRSKAGEQQEDSKTRRNSVQSKRASSILSSSKDSNGNIKDFLDSSGSLVDSQDIPTAVRELNAFLVDARTKIQKYLGTDGSLKSEQNKLTGESRAKPDFDHLLLDPDQVTDTDKPAKLLYTARVVDTTLFRGYMLVQPSLAGPLFRLSNFCDPDVVNEKLLEKGRYNDLVDFFFGKGLHRSALELLRKFGKMDQEDPAAPMLHGPKRTVNYLQNLSPKYTDLILEFSDWTLEQDSELTMEVFTADSENSETLPRDKVLDFLAAKDHRLAVAYLEHLIDELNDLSPEFHNMIVNLYIERLKIRKGDKRYSAMQFDSAEQRAAWLVKLVSFLSSSSQYSTAKAFGQLPRDDAEFFEARAVILSKMGQHKQALEIYVFNMEDYAKAESYCNRVYLNNEGSSPQQSRRPSIVDDREAPPSIYHTLLSLYLAPKTPQKPLWEPALDLLSKHGSRLPAASTLKLLPAEFPVKDLESYFEGRIRAANSTVNEDRIVAGLRKVEALDAQAKLLLGDGLAVGNGGRNRKIVVKEERLCSICHRRLGGGVISVLSDNSVVHYGCANKAQRNHDSMSALRAD